MQPLSDRNPVDTDVKQDTWCTTYILTTYAEAWLQHSIYTQFSIGVLCASGIPSTQSRNEQRFTTLCTDACALGKLAFTGALHSAVFIYLAAHNLCWSLGLASGPQDYSHYYEEGSAGDSHHCNDSLFPFLQSCLALISHGHLVSDGVACTHMSHGTWHRVVIILACNMQA